MTPTADCLIIYNARRTLCERFYNDSLQELGCEGSRKNHDAASHVAFAGRTFYLDTPLV